MTLLLLTVIPLSVLILVPLGRKCIRFQKRFKMKQLLQVNASIIRNSFSEIFEHRKREYETGNKGIEKLLQFGLKEGKVQALISPVMSFVLMALLVIIVGYGGMRVSSGALTTGELVAFILYLVQIIMPMSQLSMFFTHSKRRLVQRKELIQF